MSTNTKGTKSTKVKGRRQRIGKILNWVLILLVVALLLVAAYYLLLFAVMAANVLPE